MAACVAAEVDDSVVVGSGVDCGGGRGMLCACRLCWRSCNCRAVETPDVVDGERLEDRKSVGEVANALE